MQVSFVADVLGAARRLAARASARPYGRRFFEEQRAGSRASAEAVVPTILALLEPDSVVDVGCGVGTWLAVLEANDIVDILGLDGAYVDRGALEIAENKFFEQDLSTAFSLPRQFDLAMSLEVAEHLPHESAEPFVRSLTRLAPVVLFSAAIPHQRGSRHINEQWPSYWARLFAAEGFLPVDYLRRRIWSDPRVEWWYAQNALLYVEESHLDLHPALRSEYELMGTMQLDVVHPRRYLKWRERTPYFGGFNTRWAEP